MDGVRFLSESGSMLLADEMGLGKTVQVAVALSLKLQGQDGPRALIVVPAFLRLNWARELAKWAPNLSVRIVKGNAADRQALYKLPFNVLISSYEQVRNDHLMIASTKVKFNVVVLDEAQRIKNINSSTAFSCRILHRKNSWALSGTPLENSVPDLVSVFQFIESGLLSTSMSVPEMHAKMQSSFLRRRKSEVLPDMPPILIQDLPLELEYGSPQKLAYDEIWEGRHSLDSDYSPSDMLAIITKLKQICNFEPETNTSVKLDALRDIIQGLTYDNHKLIVFSQFVETLKWIKENIETEMPIEIFHGGLNDEERNSMEMRFNQNAGPRILLISLKAGGTGLNLYAGSHVLLFDRWWNPAAENQAINRAHRFGRKDPLHVFRFLVYGTVEERIAGILMQKESLFNEYIDSADNATLDDVSPGVLSEILELYKSGSKT